MTSFWQRTYNYNLSIGYNKNQHSPTSKAYLLPENLSVLLLLRSPRPPPSPPERPLPALEGLPADLLERSVESLLNVREDLSLDRPGAAPLPLGLEDLLEDLAPLLLEAPRGWLRLMPRSVLRDNPRLLRPSAEVTGLRVRAPDRPPLLASGRRPRCPSLSRLGDRPRCSISPPLPLPRAPSLPLLVLLLLPVEALSASSLVALLREILYSRRFWRRVLSSGVSSWRGALNARTNRPVP